MQKMCCSLWHAGWGIKGEPESAVGQDLVIMVSNDSATGHHGHPESVILGAIEELTTNRKESDEQFQ